MLHIVTGSSQIGTLQNAANDLAPVGAVVKVNPGAGSSPLNRADLYTTILGVAAQNVDVVVATHDELFIATIQLAVAQGVLPASSVKITFVDGARLLHDGMDDKGHIGNNVAYDIKRHLGAPFIDVGRSLFLARRPLAEGDGNGNALTP